MDDFGEVDGEMYHFRDGKPILDGHGKMIPCYICLCSAHSANECCCGAWDWPLPEIQVLES